MMKVQPTPLFAFCIVLMLKQISLFCLKYGIHHLPLCCGQCSAILWKDYEIKEGKDLRKFHRTVILKHYGHVWCLQIKIDRFVFYYHGHGAQVADNHPLASHPRLDFKQTLENFYISISFTWLLQRLSLVYLMEPPELCHAWCPYLRPDFLDVSIRLKNNWNEVQHIIRVILKI